MSHPICGALFALPLLAAPARAEAPEPHAVTLEALELGFPTSAVPLGPSALPWCEGPIDNPIDCWGTGLELDRELGALPLVVAANGGGYRAFFFTEGVLLGLDALTKKGGGQSAFDEVDAWSTVSGSSLLLDQVLTRGLDPAALDHRLLRRQRRSLNVPTFLASRTGMQGRVVDRRIGDRGRQRLDEFQDLTGPLWVPNASRVVDGLRVPETCDTVDCDARRSAALAAFASSAVPGGLPPVRDKARAMWLMDGAWGDRLGLLTALELAFGVAHESGRAPVVLSVDSRPWPQLNNRLTWHGHLFAPIGARIQLVGYGFELLRTHADRAVLELAFGQVHHEPLVGESNQAMHQEGRDRDPDRYGARALVSHGSAQVPVLRLGADTLLSPELWDEGLRERTACQRVAARLYSAVGVQPTDLALNAPCYVDESELPGLDRKIYAYDGAGADAYDEADRQAALLLAGLLTVYLHHEQIAALLDPDGGAALTWNPQVDASNTMLQAPFDALEMNFRSWQVADEWNQCLGVRFVGDPPAPGADNHTIRLGAAGLDAQGRGYQPPPVEGGDPRLSPTAGWVSRGIGRDKREVPCPPRSSPRACAESADWGR